MVVCKCTNHSFGLNYSLWLLQNNKFLIKHDVCILGVACLCIILYSSVCVCVSYTVCEIASCDQTTGEPLFTFTVNENRFA